MKRQETDMLLDYATANIYQPIYGNGRYVSPFVFTPTDSEYDCKDENGNYVFTLAISTLIEHSLSSKIIVTVENDGDGYIAKPTLMPMIYSYGEDISEAIEKLKYEIESLYNELNENDDFSDEWLKYKKHLNAIVS